MEAGVEEVALSSLREVLPNAGEDVLSSMANDISENMGNLTADDVASLRESIQADLKTQIDQAVQNIKALYDSSGGKIDIQSEEFTKIVESVHTDFIEGLKVDAEQGFSPEEKSILNKFPGGDSVTANAPNVPNDAIEVPETVSINLNAASPKDVVVDVSHDDVLTAQKNLQEIYKGGKGDVTEAENQLKTMQKAYGDKASSLREEKQNNVIEARKESLQSEYSLKKAREAGDEDAIAQHKEELTKNEQEVKDAERANQENIKRQASQEYEQAKGARDLAKEKVKYTETLHGKGSPEAEEANAGLKEAEEAVVTARKKLLDNSGWFENNSVRLGNASRTVLEGLKSTPGLFWEQAGSQLIGGILFGLGPMGMQALEDWFNNISQVNNYKKIQNFGGILMKLPDEFINKEDPANSKFVYVGVPDEGQALNDEFLKTANYYAAKPDYGAIASSAINDANNFPNVMIHLNTGYVFVGDGSPYDPENMTVPLLKALSKNQSLKEILDELSGEVAHGAQGSVYKYYQLNKSTGYKGNSVIGSLFATPEPKGDNNYPPLLNQTITALQNGLQFGNYSVQGIHGLNGTPLGKLIGGSQPIADDLPYVAQGVYIYQTKDTPFIKNIRSSLLPANPEDKAVLDNLVDYVVFLDDVSQTGRIVPLQVPIPQAPYEYATYALNPDAKYMVSLLEVGGYAYDASKKGVSPYLSPTIKVSEQLFQSISGDLIDQIDAIQLYCAQQAKKGPFSYGSVNLTIDSKLIDSGAYVYKAADYLGTGIDDYFVGIKGTNAIQLPSTDVQFFVSLVTSRFYTAGMKPYGGKLANSIFTFNVGQIKSGSPFVTTSLDTTKFNTLYTGKSSLYTLFMEYPFNPIFGPETKPPVPPTVYSAFTPYWGLNHLTIGAGTTPPSIMDFLQGSQPMLLSAIQTAHNNWIKTVDTKNPAYVIDQMGPFDFAQTTLGPIQVQGVSDDAIANQNYVYISDNYPDEYLVMADDVQGTKNLGQAFSGQPYAISLTNGNVYAAVAPGTDTLPGSKVSQKPLDVDLLLKQAQIKPYNAKLLQKIKDSQTVYDASIINYLYGPATGFGTVLLYINKQDYFANQFIYADVTGLARPINAQGNEIASVISQVTDYYVCVERTPVTDSSGNQEKDDQGNAVWDYDFGTRLGANTYSIISLISGASFDRTGNYLGSYAMFKIKESITDVLGFANRTLGIIAQKSGQSIRDALVKKIKALAQQTVKNIDAYNKQLVDQEAKDKKPPLSGDIIAQLQTVPYVDNSNLLPRYLKYYKAVNKYYVMTPGYVYTTPPAGTPTTNLGPDTTFIDFNSGDQTKDSGMGMMYNSTGKAIALLNGWALLQARNFAGIVVNAKGQQQRMMGLTVSKLPMLDANKKPCMVPATGFDSITSKGTTFAFYYHTQLDAFFVKVTSADQSYYFDLNSGYGYNLDGTPRWFQSDVYTDKSGNKLLIGFDADDVRKVALAPTQAAGKQAVPYGFYTMVGKFNATESKDYQVQGTYYEMVNDVNPDQKIRVMLCTTTLVGEKIHNPFYLVWSVSSNNQFTLLGRYDKDPGLYYSLLLYAQTRTTGQPVEQGIFVNSDNYITDIDNIPLSPARPKAYGIVFDKNHMPLGIFYQNQLCMFNPGSMVAFYNKTNEDGSATQQKITVKINNKLVQPSAYKGIGLTATWLTIEDGNTSYDFEFDYYLLNPELEVCNDSTVFHLNLALLKQGSVSELQSGNYCEGGFGGINVSSYVPFGITTSGMGRRALVSQLNAQFGGGNVYFPGRVSNSIQKVVNNNARKIQLDNAGNIFIYNKVSGTINRYVYTLGQPQDIGQAYYAPEANGWLVDISNGILYDNSGFPTGQSLTPSQLDILLDLLQLKVGYDKKGLPYRLEYRYAKPPAVKK